MNFVSVKDGSASISNVAHATFYIEAEPCLTETKCNFRTLEGDECFWTKQQYHIQSNPDLVTYKIVKNPDLVNILPLTDSNFLLKKPTK